MQNNYRYFIKLAYKGTHYHGWQIQENAISIQEEINNSLSLLMKKPMNVVGCGRTDTGVHATEFYAHFDIDLKINKTDALVYKLNSMLSKDICIDKIFIVSNNFHARFDAVLRTYKYYIHQKKDPFLQEFSLFFPHELNIDLINEASTLLYSFSDFTSFSKAHTDTKTNICKISFARIEQQQHQLVFTITADRFLRNMVRAIVGTLLNVGQLKISLEEFSNIIAGKDRSLAGASAPAKALFLNSVSYTFLE